MSLLSIVQDSMVQCGFSSPSTVYSNTDDLVTLFVRLSMAEGDSLSRAYDWRALKVLGQLTGDGTSTDFDLPTDFDRFVTGYPIYKDESASGPLQQVSDDQMMAMKAMITRPVLPVWRLLGDTIEFYPALDDGDVYKLEYRTKYWITDELGTSRRARWAADTDISVMPDRLITLGCVWRFKQAKGFDYAEDFRTYRIEVAKAASVENGRMTLRARSHFVGDYSDAPFADPRVIP
jgi:hypothetical protein